PRSPFAARALDRIMHDESSEVPDEDRLRAARLLIARYPHAREVEMGANLLQEYYPGAVSPEEMAGAARVAAGAAARYRRPAWLVTLARIQASQGQNAAALATARQALADAEALRDEEAQTPGISELAPHIQDIDGARKGAEELIKQLTG